MAVNTQMSDYSVNLQADAWATQAANAYLRIYDGAQPANADVAVSTQVLLAELRLGATAFGAAVSGVLTANAVTADSAANATGTAAWFRLLKSDGTTALCDGSVGTATSNLIIATTTITALQTVSCSSFTHDVRNATSGI